MPHSEVLKKRDTRTYPSSGFCGYPIRVGFYDPAYLQTHTNK